MQDSSFSLFTKSLKISFRYLQEVGYTDTILDVRSSRVRSILGLSVSDSSPDNCQPNGIPPITRGQEFAVIEDHVRPPKRNETNVIRKLSEEEEADGILTAPPGKRLSVFLTLACSRCFIITILSIFGHLTWGFIKFF